MGNRTAEAHLFNKGGTVSPLISRLACHILNLDDKHGITLNKVNMPTNLNV